MSAKIFQFPRAYRKLHSEYPFENSIFKIWEYSEVDGSICFRIQVDDYVSHEKFGNFEQAFHRVREFAGIPIKFG